MRQSQPSADNRIPHLSEPTHNPAAPSCWAPHPRRQLRCPCRGVGCGMHIANALGTSISWLRALAGRNRSMPLLSKCTTSPSPSTNVGLAVPPCSELPPLSKGRQRQTFPRGHARHCPHGLPKGCPGPQPFDTLTPPSATKGQLHPLPYSMSIRKRLC